VVVVVVFSLQPLVVQQAQPVVVVQLPAQPHHQANSIFNMVFNSSKMY
jgi:hypothetical protein